MRGKLYCLFFKKYYSDMCFILQFDTSFSYSEFCVFLKKKKRKKKKRKKITYQSDTQRKEFTKIHCYFVNLFYSFYRCTLIPAICYYTLLWGGEEKKPVPFYTVTCSSYLLCFYRNFHYCNQKLIFIYVMKE